MRLPGWLLILVLGVTIALVACSGDKPEAGPVPEAVAVHPCDDSSQDVFGVQPSRLRDTPAATPAAPAGVLANDSSGFGSGVPGCDGPDFSQRCALWAAQEYDDGSGQDIGCGTTMAQCGCALTSAASLLLRYGVTRGPDGQPTTPASLNDWFKRDSQVTSGGTVSQGFVYGGVNWLAVAAYSKLAAVQFGTPELTFAGSLGGDVAALRREVETGRPVILEQPGHFILATGETAGAISISDPFYAERTRLDTPSYGNRFVSGRLYKAGPDVSALMVAAPRGLKFTVRDASGAVTGLKSGAASPVSEIKQSTFSRDLAWRDPTCTLAPPKLDSGVDMAIVSTPGAGIYEVDVTGGPDGRYSVAVYAYDQAGGLTLRAFDGAVPASGSVKIAIDYSPLPAARQIIEVEGETGGTPAPAAASATSAPTATPAARTPAPGLATSTSTPPANLPATLTPTRSPTPPPSTASKLELTIAPTAAFCNDTKAFALITAKAFDSGGKPRPNVPLRFVTSVGSVTPSTATTSSNGSATARLYPGTQSALTQIRVTVSLQSNTNVTASASFTCKVFIPPPVLAPGPN